MKKFIIAVCGILALRSVFGALPDHYGKPFKVSDDIASKWGVDSNVKYGSPLDKTLYPDLQKQISRFDNGTYKDEGAIIIWAARDIYEHGAKFCKVQVQAANANMREYVWLDYYWKDDQGCNTLCENGWSGSRCDRNILNCSQPGKMKVDDNISIVDYVNPALFSVLRNSDLLSKGQRHTGDMSVLDYENEEKGVSSVIRQANHVLFGIVEPVDYGVKVAPIKVIGERTKTWSNGIKSWIVSANYQDGAVNVLCRSGYKPNSDGTKCIKNPDCENPSEFERQNWDWCAGFSDFDPDKYVVEYDESKRCKYYMCINDNYGFKSDGNHTCIPCGSGKNYERYGVDLSGYCLDCEYSKQIFEKSKRRCVNATQYTKAQMFENNCWLETDPDEFCKCVTNKVCPK